MKYELIDGVPAANERELIGNFLRYAFPLKQGLFADVLMQACSSRGADAAFSRVQWVESGRVDTR